MQQFAQRSAQPLNQQCRPNSLGYGGGKLAKWAGAGIGALLGAALWPPHAGHALTLRNAMAGPLFEPLVASEPEWLRSLVWNDFRCVCCSLKLQTHTNKTTTTFRTAG